MTSEDLSYDEREVILRLLANHITGPVAAQATDAESAYETALRKLSLIHHRGNVGGMQISPSVTITGIGGASPNNKVA